jgi:hypothetical protein
MLIEFFTWLHIVVIQYFSKGIYAPLSLFRLKREVFLNKGLKAINHLFKIGVNLFTELVYLLFLELEVLFASFTPSL